MANTAGPQASIGNGQTMNADAAVYWHALVAAVFVACGVWVVATEGTRTWQRQFYLWVNRLRPGFNPAWHPDDPRANHVAGRCVDVGSGVGFILTLVSAAFYKLAGLYGFRATVPGEPWHFEWRDEWVSPLIRAQLTTSALDRTPIDPSKEDDMALTEHDLTLIAQQVGKHARGGYILRSASRSALVGPGYAGSLNRAELANLQTVYPQVEVTEAEFDQHVAGNTFKRAIGAPIK